MTLIDLIEDGLKRHGYDGLYNSGVCACKIGDLAPCGGYISTCEPGVFVECSCDNCPCDFHIGPRNSTRQVNHQGESKKQKWITPTNTFLIEGGALEQAARRVVFPGGKLMNFGLCPYCGKNIGPFEIPDEAPAFAKVKCENCGKDMWYRLSRIDPQAWRIDDFEREFKIDETTRTISPVR